ncbi:E3 ubiquitin-protein ligase RNF26 [Ornithorhynchus anatinus]|uniref:E3 ubiquitin-protein ligase RNF26 n=1 Tax=Ornithorhynchus anatinus TaxID=9258 RepID=A0A6I8PKD6_ORNAN|nr:E3 ubiquitin-protein ligase RNF26 [Ornithorhynchus anatinus]
MDVVFLVVNGVGLALDVLSFLLDLNFFLVSSLLAAVVWLLAFVYNLPGSLLAGLLLCGRGTLLSLAALAEALGRPALGAVQAAGALLRGCCSSGLESLKVAGHLASHVGLRGREVVHRGVWGVVSSGQALLRQACDVCTIAMSLAAYVVNSLVNMCLIGTQNLFSLALALWDSVVGPLWRVTDLLAAFLSHASSSAVATAILLWTPCQLVLELLSSAARLLAAFVLGNLSDLAVLACVLALTLAVLHPGLALGLVTRAAARVRALPPYRWLRGDVARLCRLLLGSEAWRRVRSRGLQLAHWPGGGGARRGPREAPGAPQGGPRRGPPAAGAPRPHEPPAEPAPGPPPRVPPPEEGARTGPGGGRERLNEEENDPWKLLKEQEERKKCVICQDRTKTVLLLPCRHLCLCQACTEILLGQPVYQRNCPLCRQGILQTLNVYL